MITQVFEQTDGHDHTMAKHRDPYSSTLTTYTYTCSHQHHLLEFTDTVQVVVRSLLSVRAHDLGAHV